MRRVLLLCVVLAACGDDAGTGPDAETCAFPLGSCDGDVLSRCEGTEIVTQDCAADLEACVFVDDDAGFGCVNLCAVAGVGDTPTCEGNAVVQCAMQDGHRAVITETCGAGLVCADGACQADPCNGIGPQGRCDGDTQVACVDGAATSTDCAATGDVCAYVDHATGYACVAAGATGAMVVSGVVRYEDRAPLTSGALGPPTPAPARGAVVSLILDANSSVLATALTSDDGSYTLRYDATVDEPVHVLATSYSPLPIRPIRVRRNGTQLHGFGGASFAAAASTAQHDLLATVASDTAEAFNILDQVILGMDTIRAVYADPSPPELTVRWVRGTNQGTYYGSNEIFLLGQNSDNDGYDDTVILHEFGHYLEDVEGRSDNPGGGHDGSPDDPRLAWSEGFSTYFAMAVRGIPYYMDSNSGGGWGWNGDESITIAPFPTGALDQDVSEDMVCEDLWDLGDGGLDDDNPMTSGGHVSVLQIEQYLRTAVLRDVGHEGVDLVDGLDGWFIGNGLASCGPVDAVVTGVRMFPYDYDGPAGRCP